MIRDLVSWRAHRAVLAALGRVVASTGRAGNVCRGVSGPGPDKDPK